MEGYRKYVIKDLTKEQAEFVKDLLFKFFPEDEISVAPNGIREYAVFCDFNNTIFDRDFIMGFCDGAISASDAIKAQR